MSHPIDAFIICIGMDFGSTLVGVPIKPKLEQGRKWITLIRKSGLKREKTNSKTVFNYWPFVDKKINFRLSGIKWVLVGLRSFLKRFSLKKKILDFVWWKTRRMVFRVSTSELEQKNWIFSWELLIGRKTKYGF